MLRDREKNPKESFPSFHDLKSVNELLKEEIRQLVVENSKLADELKEIKTHK